jgi:peptidoglycan DL-endopeptidase CwlO
MRTPWPALFTLASIAALVVAAIPGSSSAEPSTNIEQVRKQVDQLYERAEQVTEQANALDEQIKVINRKIRALDADVRQQQRRVASLRTLIGQQAATEYRTGGSDTTVRVLVAHNPAEFLAQMSTARAFAEQQADQLRMFQVARKRLAEQEAARSADLEQFRKAKQAVDVRRKAALRNAARAKAILDRLTAEQKRRLAAAEARREAEARASRAARSTPKPTPSPSPSPTASPKPSPKPSPTTSTRGVTALNFAKAQLGEPYVFAADGPDSWDCSGLTMKAWEAAGVSLPHSAHEQYDVSPHVSKSDLQLGDLVFFYSDMHHVGIYAGNGEVIHAPRPGENVQYIKMSYMPYAGAARPG